MFCHYHPETIAIERCFRCRKPICKKCQQIIKGNIFCLECSRLTIAGITLTPQRSPWFAALLTLLFPGAGQVYNGEVLKGFIVLLTFWLIIPWFYGVYDAYRVAVRINFHAVATRPSMTRFLSFIVLVFLLFISSVGLVRHYRNMNAPQKRIQDSLAHLGESLETYAWVHNSYPESYAQFYKFPSAPLEVLMCQTVWDHYRIDCEFSAQGYAITATPTQPLHAGGPSYTLQTGGVISTQ